MVTGKAQGLIIATFAVVSGCGRTSEAALPLGARFPLVAADAPVQVVWVVRPEDYLTCQTAAGGLREFQRKVDPGVPLTVLYTGPHASWLDEFLRQQRITATILAIREADFRRAFARKPGPWLYFVRGGVVQGVLPGGGYVRPATSWSALVDGAGVRRAGEGSVAGAALHNFKPGAGP